MKKVFVLFILSFFSLFCFSLDFSKIKEGMSKKEIVTTYGEPFKIIKDSNSEIDLWITKKNIYLVYFTNEISDGEATKIDDILSGILSLKNTFSGLSDLYSENNKTEISPKKEENIDSKIDKSILKDIDIKFLDCSIHESSYDKDIGYSLKVKNRSNKEISKLTIRIFFYDKTGKVFFETDHSLLNDYSTPRTLKPNYSALFPESSSSYYYVRGIDIDEWNEGKYSFKIIELE